MEELYEKYQDKIYFKLIVNKNVSYENIKLESVIWNKDAEIEQLSEFDIGIMPLPDDKWSKGKCGFKAIQYMSLGIPPLVSPVGMNTELVDDGVNGFVCDDKQSWLIAFEELIANADRRSSMGDLARKKIIASYSKIATKNNFIQNLC